MSTNEKYDKIFLNIFDVDKEVLNEDFTFQNVEEWTSFLHLTLITELEDEFNILLDTDDIIHFGGYINGKKILEKYGVSF